MCGRYSNEREFSQVRLLFQAADQTFRPWVPKYNISPSSGAGHEQLIVTADRSGTRQIRLARFWFIPSNWAKPLALLPTSFNARSEDLERRRFWRQPYEHSRCLVPATGWREFTGERTPKQPYHFRPAQADGEAASCFAFAGLWSTWSSPDGEVVDSFAIVTTEPSESAARIHDRMPLLVPTDLYDDWLENDADRNRTIDRAREHTRLLRLDVFPSDPVANSVHYEGPAAVRPAPPAAPSAGQKARAKPQSPQLSLLDPAPSAARRRR